MDLLQIILRLIHVVGGIFWVGAMVFVSFFLGPAITDVGPDGGKVMAAIEKRNFMTIMPLVALLTILSGLWLFMRASTGSGEFMRSGAGMAYSLGALCAIVAFIIGMTITRPSMMKVTQLAPAIAAAPESERPAMMAKLQALRARGSKWARIIGVLLLLAATAMAVGRYV